ncbi:hypothetical protein Q1695_013058 [Nippostrongylus brasiliensis]|nr:hypothetical protein Q1695_013058 [Nippostrongylus brasiliensis]
MQSMSDAVVDFSEVNDVVAELNESDAVPDGVKSIFTKPMKVFVNKMSSVFAENAMLRQENRKLKEQIDNYEQKRRSTKPLQETPSSESATMVPIAHSDYEEFERRRSIVLKGIPELHSDNWRARVQYDWDSVFNVLSHLNVQCFPVAVYRMGKEVEEQNRLIKVVLPASYFQSLAVRRASRLRSFPGKGVYLRESLTREERLRRQGALTPSNTSNALSQYRSSTQTSIVSQLN